MLLYGLGTWGEKNNSNTLKKSVQTILFIPARSNYIFPLLANTIVSSVLSVYRTRIELQLEVQTPLYTRSSSQAALAALRGGGGVGVSRKDGSHATGRGQCENRAGGVISQLLFYPHPTHTGVVVDRPARSRKGPCRSHSAFIPPPVCRR